MWFWRNGERLYYEEPAPIGDHRYQERFELSIHDEKRGFYNSYFDPINQIFFDEASYDEDMYTYEIEFNPNREAHRDSRLLQCSTWYYHSMKEGGGVWKRRIPRPLPDGISEWNEFDRYTYFDAEQKKQNICPYVSVQSFGLV